MRIFFLCFQIAFLGSGLGFFVMNINLTFFDVIRQNPYANYVNQEPTMQKIKRTVDAANQFPSQSIISIIRKRQAEKFRDGRFIKKSM